MSADFRSVTFNYAFLQRVHETRPELLEQARRVTWKFSNDAHVEIISRFAAQFGPRPTKKVA
jgi:hypothetical protein